jgi:hypothetical protein
VTELLELVHAEYELEREDGGRNSRNGSMGA